MSVEAEDEEVLPKKRQSVEKRWTPKLSKAFTPVSDTFLKNYDKLGITTPEAMFIIHLMLHKWDESRSFPGFKTLAGRMGISDTAVRNHARSLDKKGFLKREVRRNNTNLFDLEPLFTRLESMVEEPKKRPSKKIWRPLKKQGGEPSSQEE